MQRNGNAYNDPKSAVHASQSDPCVSALGSLLIRIQKRADRFIREFMHDMANRYFTDLRMQQSLDRESALIPIIEKICVNTERALARSVKV